MAVAEALQAEGPARPPSPPPVQGGVVPALRLCNCQVERPWKACVPALARRVRCRVYVLAAWRLLGGVGAARPGVHALAALACRAQDVPEVPPVPEWLAAGELGPPSWDMVPAFECVALGVNRPKVVRALAVDSLRTGRPLSLAEVLNERADRLGVVAEDRGMRPGDHIHVWATVCILWARTKERLRGDLQGVLNERWGRNHVGKVQIDPCARFWPCRCRSLTSVCECQTGPVDKQSE